MKTNSLAARARLHAALGDEHRLAIAEELRFSDRSPTELARRLGLRTNLLAHHLDVLEESGVIERVSSSGDARRRYVRLNSAALDVMGRPTAPPPRDVLFLCTRNSARSQLAAVVWRARTGRAARSAGTRPAAAVSPGAVAAAGRLGESLDGVVPTALGKIPRGVQVITVCDLVHEELDINDGWWHWSIPAPAGKSAAFDAVVAQIEERITRVGVPPSAHREKQREKKEERR